MHHLQVPLKHFPVVRTESHHGKIGVGCCTRLHIGEENARVALLGLIIAIYLFVGAFIFQLLEAQKEILDKEAYDKLIQEFLSNHTQVTPFALDVLLSKHKVAVVQGLLYDRPRWDFSGSFYFVGTLISTIGFGMTTPQTPLGRLFVIVYGFLGCTGAILFFNLFLERIVTMFSYLLRYLHLYHEVLLRRTKLRKESCETNSALPSIQISEDASETCSIVNVDNKRTSLSPKKVIKIRNWRPSVYGVLACLSALTSIWVIIAATIYQGLEKWTFGESLYYCFVAFSTIGFGDYVASQQSHVNKTAQETALIFSYRVANFLFLAIGCCCVYSLFNVTSIIIRQLLNSLIQKLDVKCSGKRVKRCKAIFTKKRYRQGFLYVDKDTGSPQYSRRGSALSLREFLEQSQKGVLQAQKRLIMAADSINSTEGNGAAKYRNTAITENAVGPLQILSRKFGDDFS